MFELHPRLEEDTITVGYFPLCQLLISKDANYPWFILVPQLEDVMEIHHLDAEDQQRLLKESCLLSEAIVDAFSPNKMNVAALGNVVPQLHVHHIARFHDDPAWPAPIWGVVEPKEYDVKVLEQRIGHVVELLKGDDFLEA